MLQTGFGLLNTVTKRSVDKSTYIFSQWIDLCGAGLIVVRGGGGGGGGCVWPIFYIYFYWSLQECVVLKATVCFDL